MIYVLIMWAVFHDAGINHTAVPMSSLNNIDFKQLLYRDFG